MEEVECIGAQCIANGIKMSKLVQAAPRKSRAFKLPGLCLGRSGAMCCFYNCVVSILGFVFVVSSPEEL